MAQSIKTTIDIFNPDLRLLIDPSATLIQLYDSAEHTEGPVYIPSDDSIVFSDTIGDRLLCWQAGQLSVIRDPSHFQNGNALDSEGRIVACSHRDRAIVRQEKTGEWRILVDRYQGKRLNSPNDLVIKQDGTIWFTDPPFGLTQPKEGCGGQQEQAGSYVFRFDPSTGDIEAVIKEMERPNGLAFNPNEQLLYVSDTSAVISPQLQHCVRVYTLVEGRSVTNGKVFAVISPGEPDGFCVDQQGNLFISSEDSVQVYTPEGNCLGKIKVPEKVANLTFGGQQNNHLYITAGKSLYMIKLKTHGPR